MLNWSNSPGCFERHLQRKALFPFLFTADDNAISQKDIDNARQRDLDDLAKLRAEASVFLSEWDSKSFAMEDAKALHDRMSSLQKRAAEVGGEALGLVDAMKVVKESLLSQMKEIYIQAGEQKALDGLNAISALDNVIVELARWNRSDSPIESGEEVAALLTEKPETIYTFMKVMETFKFKHYRDGALKLAKEALAGGYTIPDLREKLSIFGVSRVSVSLLLTIAKLKSLFRVPSGSPILQGTSSVIAAFLFFGGLLTISNRFMPALTMITTGIVILALSRYLKTDLQDFTVQELRSVREHFPEEIGKNTIKNLAWETIAVLLLVLLASEVAMNLSNDTLSSSLMLAGAGVLAFLVIYLQANRLRVFSLDQLRKMKGSVDEELGMIRIKLAGIAERLTRNGAAVSVDELHANLKSLYHGSSPAQQFDVQRFERKLGEKYGASVPLDELYKMVTRLERGLDPFETDEK